MNLQELHLDTIANNKIRNIKEELKNHLLLLNNILIICRIAINRYNVSYLQV